MIGKEQNELEIDQNNLDLELRKQGTLVKSYCNGYARKTNRKTELENEQVVLIAEMKDELATAVDAVRVATAEKKLYYRRGGACELKKITEPALNELIDSDAEINKLCLKVNKAKKNLELAKAKSQELIDAEFNESVADGAKRAVLAKGMALQDMVKLYLNNYYADDNENITLK